MVINDIIKSVDDVLSSSKNLYDIITDEYEKRILKEYIDIVEKIEKLIVSNDNMKILNVVETKKENDYTPLDLLEKRLLDKTIEISKLFYVSSADFFELSNRSQGIFRREKFQNFKREINNIKNYYNLLSAFDILKHLKDHNKNIIIVGPNGSGKTSFANYLKNIDDHIKVIPASKPTMATGHMPSIYTTTLDDFNNEIYRGGVLKEDMLQKLIIGICTEHDDVARKFLDNQSNKTNSIYKIVKSIFEEFFDVKLDNSFFSDKKMMIKKDDNSLFDFNSMSDGERVAFFYIGTVIAAPKKSFIIVDEPETHLNPAIYNKIWDRLISFRNDCQFIFISHTMDFISARTNFELAKIENFKYPNNFDFKFIGDNFEDINIDFLTEIVGSRKPVIFCEGTKKDYDFKIYEILFGKEKTIVPVGNCKNVINNVISYNNRSINFNIPEVSGIVDSDLKGVDEIERLKEKRIYTLNCNEIEMILIDERLFKEVLNRVYIGKERFDEFKIRFFDTIKKRKEYIIKRLVKTKIDEILENFKIDDKTNNTKTKISDNVKFLFNSIDVENIWDESEIQINEIIENNNYEKALCYCCLEHNEIIGGICNSFVHDYSNLALNVLRNNIELINYIRGKYLNYTF